MIIHPKKWWKKYLNTVERNTNCTKVKGHGNLGTRALNFLANSALFNIKLIKVQLKAPHFDLNSVAEEGIVNTL